MKEGKKQKFHLDVPPGTGDSSRTEMSFGVDGQKEEQVGRWQSARAGRKETSNIIKRRFVLPVNRCLRNGGEGMGERETRTALAQLLRFSLDLPQARARSLSLPFFSILSSFNKSLMSSALSRVLF